MAKAAGGDFGCGPNPSNNNHTWSLSLYFIDLSCSFVCLMFLILSFVCHKELAETGLYGVILWFEGGSAIRGHRHNHHLPWSLCLFFWTQFFKPGKTFMLILQCDSYFHSSLRPQMSSETNGGDGHGGEYWPVMVYHDGRHSWDAAMINDHNYEYIPIRHPKHLMHLAECIIQWPHYFCLILLHASPFSSSIERFVLFLITVLCNNFGLNRRWSMQKPF